MKRFKLFALWGIFVATAGCDELNLDENGLSGTNRIIDVKAGTLFHWDEYNSWAVCHEWLTGEADIYLLKNFENNTLAAHTGETVLVDGTWNKIDDSRKDTIIYEATDADLTYTGVPPTNMKGVVNVFELKVGQTKYWNYKGEKYRFSISDVKNCHWIDCRFVEWREGYSYRGPDAERVFVVLKVKSGNTIKQLKLRSIPCGGVQYEEGTDNIKRLKQLIETDFQDGNNTTRYADGALIEKNALCIFWGASYGYFNLMEQGLDNDTNLYKFIFILTDQN